MPDGTLVVLVTGGARAGKSTAIRALNKRFSPVVAEEMATKLFRGGIQPPSGSREDLLDFQRGVFALQRRERKRIIAEAASSGERMVVEDRGDLDAAGYLPGGWPEAVELLGVSREEVYADLDLVIHLQSTACLAELPFNNDGNAFRFETEADRPRMVENDAKIAAAYADHPNWHYISAAGGVNAVVEKVVDLVSSQFNSEIERKWLIPPGALAEVPDGWVAMERLRNFYTRLNPEERYRETVFGDGRIAYERTVKHGKGLRRFEGTSYPDKEEYQLFMPLAIGRDIFKMRYQYPDGGSRPLSLDVFQESLAGHITLEREFATELEAEAYEPPSFWRWFNPIEVTGQKPYSGLSLALNGLPVGE